MGRRKIEIKKIEKKPYLKATYTKRRKGLFGKAAELCAMCGAEIAILTVSPGGKFYNFGHPDVDSIVARYRGDEIPDRVEEDHDSVSHEDDDDDDLAGEQEVTNAERERELEGKQEEELEVTTDEGTEPMACEEKDHSNQETNLFENINRGIGHLSLGSNHKFWWDEEPDDPEQLRRYYQSLKQLRNNVVWLLNDRNMRESCTKDYFGGI
ncbi:agamous-like MADS-box protein AGL29 [Argentina anserina]|uniref:agamous-like MADS-box protein AGL29 n=1 Tax=Argentina anserina TaxID=57926 RepID=UPI0021762431|nr:agamous-like MADS-box protein AGL29 [Potentilla anserina]